MLKGLELRNLPHNHGIVSLKMEAYNKTKASKLYRLKFEQITPLRLSLEEVIAIANHVGKGGDE